MNIDKSVAQTFPNPIEAKKSGPPVSVTTQNPQVKVTTPHTIPPSLVGDELFKLPEQPGRTPTKHPHPLPPSLDSTEFKKLPGNRLEVPSFFNQFDNLIDDAISAASRPACRCPHGNPVQSALRSFHNEIKSMSQKDLDSLKDTLVKRMASRDSSQTERELMQKLYDITDAVSEHREPPHLHDFFDFTPTPMPIRIGDLIDQHPSVQQIEIKF